MTRTRFLLSQYLNSGKPLPSRRNPVILANFHSQQHLGKGDHPMSIPAGFPLKLRKGLRHKITKTISLLALGFIYLMTGMLLKLPPNYPRHHQLSAVYVFRTKWLQTLPSMWGRIGCLLVAAMSLLVRFLYTKGEKDTTSAFHC